MFRYRQEKRGGITLILITVFVLFFLVVFHLRSSLSRSERVNAEILVVEGWIPPSEFRLVHDEFERGSYRLIVTTGLESTADYFDLYSNGSLVFDLTGKFINDTARRNHLLAVRAFGSMGGKNSAHFNIILNDSVASEFMAGKRKRYYKTEWFGRLSELDSLSVRFLNYTSDSSLERTLFVRSLEMDNILIPYMKNSTFSVHTPSGNLRIRNDFSSYPAFARRILISMGIDSSKIIAVACKNVSANRTLASASAFNEWIRSQSPDIRGVNVVTIGVHGKRTRMTYKTLLRDKYNVGIIALPDYRAMNSPAYDIFRSIRETFETAYYWIVLWKYR